MTSCPSASSDSLVGCNPWLRSASRSRVFEPRIDLRESHGGVQGAPEAGLPKRQSTGTPSPGRSFARPETGISDCPARRRCHLCGCRRRMSSHSQPRRRTHNGARIRSPAQRSANAPTPIHSRAGRKRCRLRSIRISCKGFPIATNSRCRPRTIDLGDHVRFVRGIQKAVMVAGQLPSRETWARASRADRSITSAVVPSM